MNVPPGDSEMDMSRTNLEHLWFNPNDNSEQMQFVLYSHQPDMLFKGVDSLINN